MKMEFPAGEFLRVGSQLLWEQAGLENFEFRPAIYTTSELTFRHRSVREQNTLRVVLAP